MDARSLFVAIISATLVACSETLPLPEDGFVNVVGGRIAFRVTGSGRSIPVLWIHGGPGGSSCAYIENLSGLASERPIVFYDQLGSGYSDRIEDVEQFAQLPRFVAEIAAVRAELGLREVHLVGHSWGATVLLEYLLTTRPDGVKSSVFIGPFFGAARWNEDAHQLVEDMPEKARQAISAAIDSGAFETDDYIRASQLYNRRYWVRKPPDQPSLAPCRKMPSGDSGIYRFMWGPSDIVVTGTLKNHERISRLSELDLPVLFVAGQHDMARPETVERYQAMVGGSRLVVLPDAGHAVHLDQAGPLNNVLADFFIAVEK
jgi:proline iminopeptidase